MVGMFLRQLQFWGRVKYHKERRWTMRRRERDNGGWSQIGKWNKLYCHQMRGRSLGTECIAKKNVQNFLCTMNWFFCFLLTSSLTEEFILLFNAHFGASLYKEVASIFCLLDIIQACFFDTLFWRILHLCCNKCFTSSFPRRCYRWNEWMRFIQSNV